MQEAKDYLLGQFQPENIEEKLICRGGVLTNIGNQQ